MRLLTYFLLLCSLTFTNCKKLDDKQVIENDEKLSASELALIDALKTDNTLNFNDLLFNDSSSIQEFLKIYNKPLHDQVQRVADVRNSFLLQKKLFIANMSFNGLKLTKRDKFPFPKQGDNEPEQNGLAYVYGAKQFKQREKPDGACNSTLRLHGLDCSGFIYQISQASGLNLTATSVSAQNDTAMWNKAFSSSPQFSKLKMRPLKSKALKDLEPGDIIIWKKHIGMITQDGRVMHSSGYANENDGDCNLNLTTRGPRVNKLTQNFLNAFGGGPVEVFRVTVKDCDIGGEIVVDGYKDDDPLLWSDFYRYEITGGRPPYAVEIFVPNVVHQHPSIQLCELTYPESVELHRRNGVQRVTFKITDSQGEKKDTVIFVK